MTYGDLASFFVILEAVHYCGNSIVIRMDCFIMGVFMRMAVPMSVAVAAIMIMFCKYLASLRLSVV